MRNWVPIGMAIIFRAASADVLILDLNNADKENKACSAADDGHVWVVNRAGENVRAVNAKVIENAIARMEAAGKTIDTLAISGHDGNCEFFGGDEDENSLTAVELKEILDRHPKTKESLSNFAYWGCYPDTVDAITRCWARPFKKSVFTIGYPLQSPTKEHELSHELIHQFCRPENREKAAKAAVSNEALCEFYKNMPLLRSLDAAVSNCSHIATRLYGSEECHSMDDLVKKCDRFDPSWDLTKTYYNYLVAVPGYEDPPLDGADVYAERGQGPLRRFYNQVHLWRHCADQLKKDFGYDMPYPGQIIRLVKFKQVKDNINFLNREELADYDARLASAGLGDLALGDLEKVSRRELVLKVKQAVRTLESWARRGTVVGSTRADVVWRMALGIKATLVDMEVKGVDGRGRTYKCSHFSLVHAGSSDRSKKSQCIRSYVDFERSLRR